MSLPSLKKEPAELVAARVTASLERLEPQTPKPIPDIASTG
jgi:hypothetical protein